MSENEQQAIDSAFKILSEAVDLARSLSDNALVKKLSHFDEQIKTALLAIISFNEDELLGVLALRGDIFAFAAEIYERADDLQKSCLYGRAAISETQNCYAIIGDKHSLEALLKALMFQLSRNLSLAIKLNETKETLGLREENTLILGTIEHFLKIAEHEHCDIFEEFSHFYAYITHTKCELKMEKLPYFAVTDTMAIWPFDTSGLSIAQNKLALSSDVNNPDQKELMVLDEINDEFELLEETFEEAFEEGAKIETQINALNALLAKIPQETLHKLHGLSLSADIEFSVGKYHFAMSDFEKAISSFRNSAKNAFYAFNLYSGEEIAPRMFEIMIAIAGCARELDNIDEARLASGTAISIIELLKVNYSLDELEDEIAISIDLAETCIDLGGDCEIWYPEPGAKWPFDENGLINELDNHILTPSDAPIIYSLQDSESRD